MNRSSANRSACRADCPGGYPAPRPDLSHRKSSRELGLPQSTAMTRPSYLTSIPRLRRFMEGFRCPVRPFPQISPLRACGGIVKHVRPKRGLGPGAPNPGSGFDLITARLHAGDIVLVGGTFP